MLTINRLSKTYGKDGVRAVDDLSLEVRDGEIFGFIGPNGAGKSTTIKCLTGILDFEEGEIIVDGHDLKKETIAAKKAMGYVSDSHIIYDRLTGMDYVNFMRNVYGGNGADESLLKKYLDMFSLSDAINKPIKSYSHGMKQKINVIGAIIHQPRLLVLDEPLTGLDPQSAFQLKTLMKEHCKNGNTVFFSSHVLDVVEKVCDRVGIIDKGRLIAAGSVSELRANASSSLESFFLSITSKEGAKESGEI